MKSSGKRGLAALAISAVAVTGIPALAMANTIDSQVTPAVGATDVQLYNDDFSAGGGNPIDLTAKSDGTDTTVRLEAGGGINVPAVTFQVSRNGGVFADIATVSARNDDGAFSYEWTPADNGAFAGDSITLRAVNAANIAETDTETGFILRNASALNTQAINIAAGEQRGYFVDPDAPADSTLGVTGTTSVTRTAAADRPGVAWLAGNGTEQDFTFNTSNTGDGTWEGVLRFNGYPFDNPALPPVEADQMVVRAVTDTVLVAEDQTDDLEAFTLYEQTLTSLTCTIAPQTEPDPGLITVTVLDQNGAPIAGIDVFEDNGDPLGETDGRGQVVTPEADDLQYFYANADSPNAFSPGAGDKRSPDCNNQAAVVDIVTSPSEAAQPVGTTVTETVTVTDTNGDPISNRPVRIKRDGPGSEGETVFKTTDDNGMLTYAFTCSVEGVANIEVGISGPVGPLVDPFTYAIASDSVTCGVAAPLPPSPINVKLTGKSSEGKDILKVNAPSKAAGASVTLQRKDGNQWVNVGKVKKLDSAGDRQFSVKDKNGKSVTKYRARVAATADTKADTSPVLRLK